MTMHMYKDHNCGSDYAHVQRSQRMTMHMYKDHNNKSMLRLCSISATQHLWNFFDSFFHLDFLVYFWAYFVQIRPNLCRSTIFYHLIAYFDRGRAFEVEHFCQKKFQHSDQKLSVQNSVSSTWQYSCWSRSAGTPNIP